MINKFLRTGTIDDRILAIALKYLEYPNNLVADPFHDPYGGDSRKKNVHPQKMVQQVFHLKIHVVNNNFSMTYLNFFFLKKKSYMVPMNTINS